MNAAKLTAKQEKFAIELATGVDENNQPISQAEAYRRAFKAEKMADKTVWENASRLFNDSKVAARVQQLRDTTAKKAMITVETLLAELEEARQAALLAETPQSSAAVSATMSKAKLLGMDKQLVDVTHRVVDDGTNEW